MKDGKPNLLLLIPNLGSGGAQRIFHQHRRFLSNDFNVVCCVFNFAGAFPGEAKDSIISLDVPAGRNFPDKILNFFQRVRRLKKIKEDHHIDVTVSHLEGADYVSILSHRNDRLILWIHGSKVHDQEIRGVVGWFRKRVLLPWLYRRADKIACVSLGIASELKPMTPRASGKIVAVQNGIDIPFVQSRAKEALPATWQSLMSKYFVVVTHCRFASQKNLRSLLHVVSGLKDVIDLKFILIGDGEQRDELVELAEKLNIPMYRSWSNDEWSEDHRLFFPGQQSNPFPWLRHAKVYVLTSLWEGFPLSICEAIACGLPVVAADCFTGPKEMLAPEIAGETTTPVKGSAGIVMPLIRESSQSSIDVWIKTIRDLISDSDTLERYRVHANQNVTRFSSERSKRETITVVKSVLT